MYTRPASTPTVWYLATTLLLLVLVADAAYSRYQEYRAKQSMRDALEHLAGRSKIDAHDAIAAGTPYLKRFKEAAAKAEAEDRTSTR